MREILGDEAEFCFDIKQSVRCGLLPMETAEEFYDNIKHFHISDHSVAGDCLLPGNGKFDFKGFFEFLHNKGYKGSLVTEVYRFSYKNYEEIFDSARNIRKLIWTLP